MGGELHPADPQRIGPYRLIRLLGSGGMGRVYLGRSAGGWPVAVKVIRAELAADPEFRTRFRREVAAARKVNGLYTALVVDTDLDGLMPWLATAYVAGPSLADAVTSYGPLPAASVLMLAAGLAEALGAIHAVGVVHRDLKPSNVLLADDGPRVIDFGISQAAEASTLTRVGVVVGSPGFMSPEQAEGREVGPPSDVFSLGSILTFAATGRGPFGTGPTAALVYRVVHGPPELDSVPAEIRSLVLRCLAKDPSRRPAPGDLLAELGDTDLAAGWLPTPIKRGFPWHAPLDSAPAGATAVGSRAPEPADEAFLAEVGELGQIDAELTVTRTPERLGGRPAVNDSLLLEPALPRARRPSIRRNLVRRNLVTRHMATIGVPVIALVAVAALTLVLLASRPPKLGPQVANQGTVTSQSTLARATFGRYPGQQQRGVFQKIDRVIASGNTIVAMGSQTSGDITRQQFFASADGGATWHLAQVHAPGGGEPPLGHAATLLAGGPGGWAAVGPQAVWTSHDGESWTLAATRGIAPQLPGDNVWVVTKTADGFLAAGEAAAGRGATQAVIWTSPDGVTWQRMTAAQLGLAAPGELVQNIAYATSRGDDTVISGSIFKDGATYSGAWLSTDGGSGWTRVTMPADHGAGTGISGLGFDGSGLIAVRAGRAASGTQDGVAYFSPNGLAWQYAGTIDAAGGWSPGVVKGSDHAFVVTGTSTAGKIVAYISTGTGATWQPTGALGDAAAEMVTGATVAPTGTVIATGHTTGSKVSQQPVFVEANTAGSVQPVSLGGILGASNPQLAVNSLAIDGSEQIAVGGADGYPAVWRKAAAGSWVLVSSLSSVSAEPGLAALTSVTHGPAGWLAVGVPGPIVLSSADGTTWRSADGSISSDLGDVSAVAAAAGPAGYVAVGELAAPAGDSVADVWWSSNLNVWTRARVNEPSGSNQVLGVAGDADGFVSVGSHDSRPAVWTTADGRTWTTKVLPLPAGASNAVLQQVAVHGNRVVAMGEQTTAAGTMPLAEISSDRGASWQQTQLSSPGPGTAITALTADASGCTAMGQFGELGQQAVAEWTSADGVSWTQSRVSGLGGPRVGGIHEIAALVSSGSTVTGIGSIESQLSGESVILTLPARR